MASFLRLSCADRPALVLDELSTQHVLEYLLSDQPSATRAIARAFVGSERRRAVYVLYREPGAQAIGRRIDTKKDPQSRAELRALEHQWALDDESTGCPAAGSSEGEESYQSSEEASDLEDLRDVERAPRLAYRLRQKTPPPPSLIRRRLCQKTPPPLAYRLLAARSAAFLSLTARGQDTSSEEEEEPSSSYTDVCEACGQHVTSQVDPDGDDECNTGVHRVATLSMNTYLDLEFLPPRAQAFAWARRTSLELCLCGGGQRWLAKSCFDSLLFLDENLEEEDAEGWQPYFVKC